MANIQERLKSAGMGEDRAYYTFHDAQRVAGWAGPQATEVLVELGLTKERGYFTRHDVMRVANLAIAVVDSQVIGRQVDSATAHVVHDVPEYLYDRYTEQTSAAAEDVA